jgi:hypothetical protein
MIGDTDYQVRDLLARVRILENKSRAVVPGNAPSRGPDHPSRVLTSEGQLLHGADSDLSSRIISGIQSGFAGIESLQFNQRSTITVLNTATTVPIISIPVRPDPVVGDLYRLTIAGDLQNGAVTQFNISGNLGGTSGPLLMTTAAVNAGAFFSLSYYNITTAGSAGVFTHTVFQCISTSGQAFIDASCAAQPVAGANLVYPSFDLSAFFTAATSTANIFVRTLILESMGYRQG